MPMTAARKKAIMTVETAGTAETTGIAEAVKTNKNGEGGQYSGTNLAQVPYIRYAITFLRKSVLTLLDLSSKSNAIYPTFIKKLELPIRLIDVRAQKFDNITLDSYEMVVTVFLITNKTNRVKFFKETFLVANISPKIVFKMFFFTLSDTDIDFLDWELRWRSYTT